MICKWNKSKQSGNWDPKIYNYNHRPVWTAQPINGFSQKKLPFKQWHRQARCSTWAQALSTISCSKGQKSRLLLKRIKRLLAGMRSDNWKRTKEQSCRQVSYLVGNCRHRKSNKTTHLTISKLKLWIYEIHIFELRNEEINVKKILAVINTTFAVAKRKPEKIRLAGTRTLTSAIPVQRSNQLS